MAFRREWQRGVGRMMYPMEMEDVALVELEVELYLTGRETPVWAPTIFSFSLEDPPEDVEAMTDFATSVLLEQMDSRSRRQMVFESAKHTKVIVNVDMIQSITVLAPDDMPEELKMEDEDGKDSDPVN
jgi:hypothetical protein